MAKGAPQNHQCHHHTWKNSTIGHFKGCPADRRVALGTANLCLLVHVAWDTFARPFARLSMQSRCTCVEAVDFHNVRAFRLRRWSSRLLCQHSVIHLERPIALCYKHCSCLTLAPSCGCIKFPTLSETYPKRISCKLNLLSG